MTRNIVLLASTSMLVVATLGATPVFAAGTTAGSTITNNVTLSYKVGGVTQTQKTASDSFTVDRKVNLTVADLGSATTSVSPGQQAAVTTFRVTNTSNDVLDFALSATQLSGGTAAHGGTDNFDVSNVKVYVDTNGNGTFDASSDTEITYLDELAADASKTVFVVVDVPLNRSTSDVAGVRLTATSAEGESVGSLGATVTGTAGANTAQEDTVLADTNAGGNTARDGVHFAEADYTVAAAAITLAKTSRVISDPYNNTTNPKMIPGAVVEYCISVTNAAGSATATNVTISDTLAAQTTFLSSFGIKVNGTMTGSTCNADGTTGGTHASGVVTAPLSDIAASAIRTVLFRVTVN